MRKIILIFLSIILLSAQNAYAAEGLLLNTRTSSQGALVKETVKNKVSDASIESLRTRAKTEITRRLDFLNGLLAKLADVKKISDTDKLALQTQIQDQITGLTALQAKIDADTDLTTLKADVKSIISGYYIFAFFRVKISLLFAADRLTTVSDNLTVLQSKLQTRINELIAKGQDVSSLNSLSGDMTLKINDAKQQYQDVSEELSGLGPDGYPGNKSTLLDARSKIKKGAEDLRASYKDAVEIRQKLGDVKGNLRTNTIENKTSSTSAAQ